MAAVAQLVERQIVALNVAGSIPVGRPTIISTEPSLTRDTTKIIKGTRFNRIPFIFVY